MMTLEVRKKGRHVRGKGTTVRRHVTHVSTQAHETRRTQRHTRPVIQQTRIRNPLKHLRWRVLREQLTTFSRNPFSQNTPSQMFDRALNVSVNGFEIEICLRSLKIWRVLSFNSILGKTRSNRSIVFCIRAVLKNVATFTEQYPCWNLFFNTVEDYRVEILSKEDSCTGVCL